jgi:hypothetical protein
MSPLSHSGVEEGGRPAGAWYCGVVVASDGMYCARASTLQAFGDINRWAARGRKGGEGGLWTRGGQGFGLLMWAPGFSCRVLPWQEAIAGSWQRRQLACGEGFSVFRVWGSSVAPGDSEA